MGTITSPAMGVCAEKDGWDRWHSQLTTTRTLPEEIDESKLTMFDERFQQEIMPEFTKKSGAVGPLLKRRPRCWQTTAVPARQYTAR